LEYVSVDHFHPGLLYIPFIVNPGISNISRADPLVKAKKRMPLLFRKKL
jgi:hypothetical protein